MKKIVIFINILFFSLTAYAQTVEWAQLTGGTTIDFSNDITTDLQGNVYTTGRFQGTVDFDPGPNTLNLTALGADIATFIMKQDASGNLIWAKAIGGNNLANAHSIAVDATGNVLVAGTFLKTVDFDPGLANRSMTSSGFNGFEDGFILKLDSQGDYVWAKQFGGTDDDDGIKSVAVDQAENVYLLGTFTGTADFDPGFSTFILTAVNFYQDIFICKLDKNGDFEWANAMGGVWNDGVASIKVGSNGDVFAMGTFQDTVDFDGGPGVSNLVSRGGRDAFLVKYNTQGGFQWARQMGGTSWDYGEAIALDSYGHIYSTGYFRETANFSTDTSVVALTSINDEDIFVSKMTTDGDLRWARRMGGSGNDNAHGIAVDLKNHVYVTGAFSSNCDFDPSDTAIASIISKGQADVFIAALDSSGHYQWANQLGGISTDQGNGVAVYANNLYVAGYASNESDFDWAVGDTILLTSKGGYDAFRMKINTSYPTSVSTSSQSSKFKIYPNPASDKLILSFPEDIDLGGVEIYDLLGRIQFVPNKDLNLRKEFDVSELSAGMYYMKISYGMQSRSVQFIKN